MTPIPLQPAALITTNAALAALVDTLLSEPAVAVDTESNSLHAYQGRICLIQLSSRTEDYIVDPIAIKDITPLGRLFASDTVEKVFHAAEYDVLCLKRDYGFSVHYLFDTLYAARMVDGRMYGLAELLQTHFSIRADKSHQLDDWGRRPLPAESLHYAQMDTHYLLPLYDHYRSRVSQRDSLDELREVFRDVSQVDPREQAFDPAGFWKLVKPNELSRREMAVLAELYMTRDSIAQELDVPPFKAIDNRVLVRLAQQAPSNRRELAQLRGLRAEMIRIYADDLLDAIERGRSAPPPRPPTSERVAQAVADRYVLLHAWRKEKAIARGLESNMVISKQALWKIAETVPHTLDELAAIDGIGAWRIQTYGAELLAMLHRR